jgi:SAM-dependent methyltransferase
VTERLDERLARLEQERLDADRLYNDALTAVDRALPPSPALPAPPSPYDATKLPAVNQAWDVIAGTAPPADGSLRGRLRAFVWRVAGPTFAAQQHFNATLADHLNRNVAAHEQAQQATAALVAELAGYVAAQTHFQSRLLHLLQTVTGYMDTKDRAVAGGHDVLNAGLDAVADSWLKRWESLDVREARFVARLSALDDLRTTTTLAQQTALSLKREVERLLAATPPAAHDGASAAPSPPTDRPTASDLDAFKYLGFEDQFRGSPEDIGRRLSEYVALFAGRSSVLDVGCGRGEFLDLLARHGVAARGLDSNHAMVEACRARGLDVVRADALAHLTGLPDGSLGGLFAAQVVEHLPPDYLTRMLETAAHKLAPGGRIVLETINPACWLAFFESYIRDLTHVRPLHPETLQYLLRVSGFHDVRVEFKSPVADEARLQPVRLPDVDLAPALADVIQAFNENVARLNARLFTFQDYAVIGER